MKVHKYFSEAVIAILMVGLRQLAAQPLPQYELSLKNPVLTGNTYQFDIYIERLGTTDFRIGNSQFILSFNSSQFTAPAITRVASSEEIGAGFFFDQIVAGSQLHISLGGNNIYDDAADISQAETGTRISSYQISGVNVPVLSPELTWINLPALIRTGVSEINLSDNYRDITDLTGASHIDGGGEFGGISGFKFNDLNGNGSWDQPAEPALNGWSINLSGPNGPYSSVTGTTPWQPGYFEFVNLTPGSYVINEVAEVNWSQTKSPDNPVVIEAGQNSQNNNFGNYNGPAILGMKFEDSDGNGIKDPGEPGLSGWDIVATMAGGGGIKFTNTDINGGYIFTFQPTESGVWEISETQQAGWLQTFPLSQTYPITVQSGLYEVDKDFGNFHPSSIGGTLFHDIDGDSAKGIGEGGLSGWKVRLSKNGSPFDSVLTDNDGKYEFDGLTVGHFTVSQEIPADWIQTKPGLSGVYAIDLTEGGTILGDRDFGNFRLGSVSGIVYYDINHNGVQDQDETGMVNITMNAHDGTINTQTLSGQNGIWSFPDLTAGTYIITETLPGGYHLTEPVNESYIVGIASGDFISGLKFGNSAAADTMRFRTISYDSFALAADAKGKTGKAVKKIPDKVEFCFIIPNVTELGQNAIHFHSSAEIILEDQNYPLVIDPPPAQVIRVSKKITDVVWDEPVPAGDTIRICGWGIGKKMLSANYAWQTFCGGKHSKPIFTMNELRWPMPNAANVRDEVFYNNGFAGTSGLVLGVARPDSQRYFGWVRLKNPSAVKNSFYDRSGLHSRIRGFDVFENGRKLTREQKFLPPTKHNNHLFAVLAALKINITASSLGILPHGLGELIYDDGVNPLSGLTLVEISEKADTALTFWSNREESEFINYDTVIAKINSAFEGPIDTISFVWELKLSGEKKLSEVPFLRANPGMIPTKITPYRIIPGLIADDFHLEQNYPNPFNPRTTIAFSLPRPAIVDLRIYNTVGQLVKTLINNEVLDEGDREIEFDAYGFASGIYFYRITAEEFDDDNAQTGKTYYKTKKMLLIK